MTPTEQVAAARAEIERRIGLAQAATPGRWEADGYGEVFVGIEHVEAGVIRYTAEVTRPNLADADHSEANAAHIAAAADPTFILGVYRQHLRVLDRHPNVDGECERCWYGWPCPEVRDLIALYLPAGTS